MDPGIGDCGRDERRRVLVAYLSEQSAFLRYNETGPLSIPDTRAMRHARVGLGQWGRLVMYTLPMRPLEHDPTHDPTHDLHALRALGWITATGGLTPVALRMLEQESNKPRHKGLRLSKEGKAWTQSS